MTESDKAFEKQWAAFDNEDMLTSKGVARRFYLAATERAVEKCQEQQALCEDEMREGKAGNNDSTFYHGAWGANAVQGCIAAIKGEGDERPGALIQVTPAEKP